MADDGEAEVVVVLEVLIEVDFDIIELDMLEVVTGVVVGSDTVEVEEDTGTEVDELEGTIGITESIGGVINEVDTGSIHSITAASTPLIATTAKAAS